MIQAWEQALNDKNVKNVIPNTPVQQGPVKSAISAIGNTAGAVAKAVVNIPNAYQNFTQNLSNHLMQTVGNYAQNVGQGFQNAGADLTNTLGGTAPQQAVGGTAAVGDVLKPAIADPENAVLKPVGAAWNAVTSKLNPVVDFLSGQPQGTTQIQNNQAGEQSTQAYQQWSQQHPTAAKALEALSSIAQAGAVIAGADQGIEGIKSGTDAADNVSNLSKTATNSLENSQVGEKPGAIERAKTEIQAGNTPAVKVRTLEDNSTVIEDGRHHLEAAKQLGIKNYPTEDVTSKYSPKISPNDTLESRLNDATPKYDSKMISKNVRTADIVDANGKVVKGEIKPRVAAENTKLGGERPVTRSASETAAGTELNNIKDYPDKGTNLEKKLAVDKAISTEAENIRGKLQAEDKASPLDTATEKAKVEDLVKSNLPKDIQEKIGYIGKDNPLSKLNIKDNPQTPLNKMLQDAMSSPEENLPKTAAGRYYQQVLDEVKNYDGTREGKLDLRQNIDSAYKNARGKLAFGSDSQNALDETNTDIRDSVNKDLKSSTKNTDTQASLDKQSRLYNARKVLVNKAEGEAPNKAGRFEQKHPTVKFVKRQLARKAVSVPLQIVGTGLGLTLAGAAAKKLIYGTKTPKSKALK